MQNKIKPYRDDVDGDNMHIRVWAEDRVEKTGQPIKPLISFAQKLYKENLDKSRGIGE